MGLSSQTLFLLFSFSTYVHQASAVHTSLARPATIYSGGKPITTSTATHVFPDPGDNEFLRPSAGEVLTAGSTYTIKWNSPAGSFVNINLNGAGARTYGELCLGWVINSRCGGLGLDVSNTGSFEWKLAIPPEYVYYKPEGEVFWLSMWQNGKSNLDSFALPDFHYSANFTIVKQGGSVASTTSPNLQPSSKTSSPPKSTTPVPTTAVSIPTTSPSKISTETPIPTKATTSSPKPTLSNPISDLSTTSTLPCCFSIETITDIPSTSTPPASTTALSNSTSPTRTSQQTSRASISSSTPTPTLNSGTQTRVSSLSSWFIAGWFFWNVNRYL